MGLSNGAVLHDVLAFSPGFEAAPARRGRPRAFLVHRDDVLPIERTSRRIERSRNVRRTAGRIA